MTVSSLFYQLLIGPIQILFEFIYGFACNVLNNYGLAIIVLSLAMNFMLMPLYKRADAIQDEEHEAEKRMKPFVAHLKKTFKGDERFMMLQTYYRQNNYKPFYVLKGFISLALEVPFFIAAYNFLSSYTPLFGSSFGPVANLGAPDQIIRMGGITVNILPVLMTAINIVSSTIYTKGSSLRDKIQLYGIALIFLVLLYNSPAGLVLYWTLNNLFSLIRNIFTRAEKTRKFIKPVFAFAGLSLIVYAAFLSAGISARHRLVFILGGVALVFPLLWAFIRNKLPKKERKTFPLQAPDNRLFLAGCLILTVLTGLLIPSSVIVSSPEEFVNVLHYYSPLRHVLHSLLLAAGAFLIWFNIFYRMSSDKGKARFGLMILVFCLVALINYNFFGTDLGLISAELEYDAEPAFPVLTQFLNIAAIAVITAISYLVYAKWRKVVLPLFTVVILALTGMSAVNLFRINSASAAVQEKLNAGTEETANFTLSRNGKNVVFIMLDRAIDFYFPYCMEEKPELKDQFAGFTWYPNTLSFGAHTLFTTGAFYGGYEYRASEMNTREGLLGDLQNEALKVLPSLFDGAGYEVTVCDPPFAGFDWIPDLSIYSDYPSIRTFNTSQGQLDPEVMEVRDAIWKRNFFCFSLMKCLPVTVQPNLYVSGDYFSSIRRCKEFDLSAAVLDAFPSITKISSGTENTYLSICNCITHDPTLLSAPDFVRSDIVDNTAYEAEHIVRSAPDMDMPDITLATDEQLTHYYVNMAAYIKIGKWLDYLREQGVYDNTRIIIAADHGFRLYQQELNSNFNPNLYNGDAMMYNPLLLVKDFGDTELKRDDAFMTNADVPSILLQDLIENPVNPFTGNPINTDLKSAEELTVNTSWDFEVAYVQNAEHFLPSNWYSFHDKVQEGDRWVLDADCWSFLGYW